MSRLQLPLLGRNEDAAFPPVDQALREPNGLLAIGGDLSATRLLRAYRSGIFPWYADGQPILWWSPDPRMVIAPTALHRSRRFRRWLRQCDWQIHIDTRFDAVIAACATQPRPGQDGTWITRDMRAAYIELHRRGHAHSVEVIDRSGRLAGAIYGIAIGRVFFGESMVSLQSGGSKLAITALCRLLAEAEYQLLDGQVESAHLCALGFAPIARAAFVERCQTACAQPPKGDPWRPGPATWQADELATLP